MLTLGLSALFQRLRSQCGGHRQQDRAGDGELPPLPRAFHPRVLCPGWAAQGGGPSARGAPHSSHCRAQPLFVCGRWSSLAPDTAQCVVSQGGHGRGLQGLGLPEPDSLGARELQPLKSQGRGGGWRVFLDAERSERWRLRELRWMSTKPWLGFQGWGGEG